MGYDIPLSQAIDEATAWANTFSNTPNAATALLDWLATVPPLDSFGEETIIRMHPK